MDDGTNRSIGARTCRRGEIRRTFKHVRLVVLPAVECDPERVSGARVFRGTRVPVKALSENLESGARIDDFVSWFPGASRKMAEAVLKHAQRSLQTEAH